MTPRFGDQVLEVFNVSPEEYDFLLGIVENHAAPPLDWKILFDESLIAGAETWQHNLDHALSLDHAHRWHETTDFASRSDAPWEATDRLIKEAEEDAPWGATDRLIKKAGDLAKDSALFLPEYVQIPSSTDERGNRAVTKTLKRKNDTAVSQYWLEEDGEANIYFPSKRVRRKDAILFPMTPRRISGLVPSTDTLVCPPPCSFTAPQDAAWKATHNETGISPYFMSSATSPSQSPTKRPPPGTVSCLPFPPLHTESFGTIQEKVAHEPFWLFVAVTFLIKTSAQAALPVFWRLKQRFAAPCDIADPSNALEILDMIRRLGLGQNRLKYIQKYARAFMFDPPRPGVRHPVRGYDVPEIPGADGLPEDTLNSGWEVGHLTQGHYAIDSWRIFCRDVLLERARDWNGKGREPEFQPEWMRVLPADKELRAFLRWMWMREGWEWNPVTGERTVLRKEMRQAVDEGRVEWDDNGALRIISAT